MKPITAALRATIIVGALSLGSPHLAQAQGMCVEGSSLMADAVMTSANREDADKSRQEANFNESLLGKTPDQRRRMEYAWPVLRANLYNPTLIPRVKFPYVSDDVTVDIKELCKPGTKILIGGLRYSAFVAGELCDFGKSIIAFNSSVICVIRAPSVMLGSP
jgi:hypothetical protein